MARKDELNFLEFLQSFRRGELLAAGDKLLEELIAAVKDTGGKGSITISLPFKLNDAGQIECVPSLSMKKPQRPMGTGIYFASEDGRLTRRDPTQHDLFADDDDEPVRGPRLTT